jgi:hypothetical protein
MTTKNLLAQCRVLGAAAIALLVGASCDGSLDPVDAAADPCFAEPRGEFTGEYCDGALTVTFLVTHREMDIDRPGFRTRGYVSATGWYEGGGAEACVPPLWETLSFQGPITGPGVALGTVVVQFPGEAERPPSSGIEELPVDIVPNVSLYLEPRSADASCESRNQLVLDWFRFVDPTVSYERSGEEHWELSRATD